MYEITKNIEFAFMDTVCKFKNFLLFRFYVCEIGFHLWIFVLFSLCKNVIFEAQNNSEILTLQKNWDISGKLLLIILLSIFPDQPDPAGTGGGSNTGNKAQAFFDPENREDLKKALNVSFDFWG